MMNLQKLRKSFSISNLKFFLGILALGLILFTTSVEAFNKKTKFKKNSIISDQIYWDKNLQIYLDPGEWEVVDHVRWTQGSITGKYVAIAQIINGDTVDKFTEIENVTINGKWVAYLHEWFEQIIFKNRHDGCYQRPEYYLLERYKKGAAFNCFLIRHTDVQRDFYTSDDPFKSHYTARIRRWIREKNYKVPKLMLSAEHLLYYPKLGRLYSYEIWINPETQGAPKNKFTTEEQSEYHKSNIDRYPKIKKFMKSFISQQAYIHQQFEEMLRAGPRQLNLDKYINEEDIKKVLKIDKSNFNNNNNNITKELKDLNELYKSGALTKEEFEKAKKKILN